MKQIYSTLLLLVLLIFPSLLFATEPESVDRVPAIRGVVYDETDTPLASATVQIEGTTNGTTTNSEGRFILRNLARKVYKINVSFVGYATQTRTVDLTSRSVAQLSFTLLPDDNLLSTVEVFGERYKQPKKLDAITRMMMHVRGSYALGILFADQPGVVYAVRKDSPLIVGKAENGSLIASDVPALLKYTRTVYYIDNLEIARLTPDSIEFFNIDKEPVEKEASTIEWDAEAAEKGGYEHFMMKEIHEQPTAVRDTLSPRIKDGRIDLSELGLDEEAIKNVRRIYIIGCGSAYHVGVAARYVFESLARLPVEVDVASEFRYRDPVLEPDSMAVIISQSGETADTLAALRECKERGVRTIGIVNVVGSSIAREADATLYTWAGPEIAVATTKAYSTQLAACYLLAVEFARVRGKIEEEKYAELVAELQILPDKIAVCGFSAGGHLALSGAVLDIPGETAQQRPNAVILGYPVVTAGEFAHRGSFVQLAGSEDAAAQQVFTLEDKVNSDTPPVFVWHTMEDKTVPVENTLLLLAALRRAGVPCEAHLFEKGAHGTSISTAEVDAADPHRAHWVALCLEWLGETFGFKLS